MSGLSEIVTRANGTALRPEAGQNRGRWARITEMVTKLSVIGILGLAGQQSISGYQAVHAGQLGMLAEQASSSASSGPIDLVFAPGGSAASATVITVADASGHTSTITVDATGTVTVD